jgi:hypothetical protein
LLPTFVGHACLNLRIALLEAILQKAWRESFQIRLLWRRYWKICAYWRTFIFSWMRNSTKSFCPPHARVEIRHQSVLVLVLKSASVPMQRVTNGRAIRRKLTNVICFSYELTSAWSLHPWIQKLLNFYMIRI